MVHTMSSTRESLVKEIACSLEITGTNTRTDMLWEKRKVHDAVVSIKRITHRTARTSGVQECIILGAFRNLLVIVMKVKRKRNGRRDWSKARRSA